MQLSNADIRKFNCCHIKMQVVTLADLIHGDGISLRENMKIYLPEAAGDSKYNWAREEPARSDWTIWRKGLRIITLENESLLHHEKLGQWITEPHKQWEWYYSPSQHRLYWILPDSTTRDFAFRHTFTNTYRPFQPHQVHQ
jgi:hypothetical protein